MKRNEIESALNEISDQYIQKAAFPKKHSNPFYLGAIAAVLALVLVAGILLRPYSSRPGLPTLSTEPQDPFQLGTQPPQETLSHGPITMANGFHGSYALAQAQYPAQHPYPIDDTDGNAYGLWRDDWKALRNHPAGYADSLEHYFSAAVPMLLNETPGENAICSPLNIYMALAMLAELTDGTSRSQILQLLQAEDIESLRTQAGQVWKSHYYNDGLSTSILGTSLWLDSAYTCNQDTAQLLADQYFASVFSGDLGTEEMDKALQSWLSSQTGGLLDDYIEDIRMDPLTTLALASTIYYQVQWTTGFSEKFSAEGTFHSPQGDRTVTFMQQALPYGPYYWGEHFGAVGLVLEDNSTMWLFLPDEGATPEELLSSGEVFQFLYSEKKQSKDLIVELQLPKFDISGRQDLVDQLKALGVTDIFLPGVADFSPIIRENDDGYVSEVTHAARMSIDEKGVTAAAFTLILRCGASMPPDERIEFVLDRPFVFVVESQDGLPLFAGTVYEP